VKLFYYINNKFNSCRIWGGEMKKVAKWKFDFKFSHSYSWIFIMGKLRSQKAVDIDANILKALTTLSLKEFPSTNQAAKHLNVSPVTLEWRLTDRKSIAESRGSTQLLSIPEEKVLAKCITRFIAFGFPVAHDLLGGMMGEIGQWWLQGVNGSSIRCVVYESIDR